MKTILLVGATGNLGGLIARALLTKGVQLRLLVCPGSRTKLAPDVAKVCAAPAGLCAPWR